MALSLPPARRRALETLGRRMTAQQLRRLEPARRHLLPLVLLHALVAERGDERLDQFDKLLRLSDGRARRRVDEQRRETARQRDELAALGHQLSRILRECAATGELPMERIRSEVGLERLDAAAVIAPGELPPIDEQQARPPQRQLQPRSVTRDRAPSLCGALNFGLCSPMTRICQSSPRSALPWYRCLSW